MSCLTGVSFRRCFGFASEAGSLSKLLNVFFQNIEAGTAISELTLGTNFDKAGIGQFLQMMRDRCLRNRKTLDDTSARQFVFRCRHLFKYLESAAIREGLRDALKPAWIHIANYRHAGSYNLPCGLPSGRLSRIIVQKDKAYDLWCACDPVQQ